jgi:hypothetical protein
MPATPSGNASATDELDREAPDEAGAMPAPPPPQADTDYVGGIALDASQNRERSVRRLVGVTIAIGPCFESLLRP